MFSDEVYALASIMLFLFVAIGFMLDLHDSRIYRQYAKLQMTLNIY